MAMCCKICNLYHFLIFSIANGTVSYRLHLGDVGDDDDELNNNSIYYQRRFFYCKRKYYFLLYHRYELQRSATTAGRLVLKSRHTSGADYGMYV